MQALVKEAALRYEEKITKEGNPLYQKVMRFPEM
jgi:hypothetical protein